MSAEFYIPFMIACVLMYMFINCTQYRSIAQNENITCESMDWHQHFKNTNEEIEIHNSDMSVPEINNNKILNSMDISSDITYIANNKTTVQQISGGQDINEEEKRKSTKEAESCISDSAEIWRQNKRIQSEKEKEYHKELKAAEEIYRRLAVQQKKLDNEDICDIWKNFCEKYAEINDLFT